MKSQDPAGKFVTPGTCVRTLGRGAQAGRLEDLPPPPDGQAARKDVLGLAEGVLRDVDSSKDALAALRAALAAEAEGKRQLQVCILTSNPETQLPNILRL